MRNVVLLSVLLVLCACSRNKLEVEGCVVGYPEGLFCLINLEGDTVMLAKIENGRFRAEQEFVPGMYWFSLGAYRERKYVAGGKVKIEGTVDGEYVIGCEVRITGLEEDDRLKQIRRQMDEDCFQEWKREREAEVDSNRLKENDYGAYVIRLSERRAALAVAYLQKETCPQFAAAIAYQNCGMYYESVRGLYEALNEEGKASVCGKLVKETLDQKQASANGLAAPDFEVENPEGQTVRLSDFRGKVVVVDAWASWCAPCRKEIVHMKKVYEQFACPDLVFMSIAMDDTKETWCKAAEEEHIPWLNLWDSAGFKQSKLRATYGFTIVPFIMVVDADGKIAGKGLIRDELSACLEKLLNN